jgi:hypothetical protein
VVDLHQVFRAELNSPGRPVGNLLFLGPTGAGNTRVVEATAEVLFGDPHAMIKVDCAEFQQILRNSHARHGRKGITTVEGLEQNGLHAVQKAWTQINVPQCGYCQVGQGTLD